jgi:hypothetical protein
LKKKKEKEEGWPTTLILAKGATLLTGHPHFGQGSHPLDQFGVSEPPMGGDLAIPWQKKIK